MLYFNSILKAKITPKSGQLPEGLGQSSFEHFQGQRFWSSRGQPVPSFDPAQCKNTPVFLSVCLAKCCILDTSFGYTSSSAPLKLPMRWFAVRNSDTPFLAFCLQSKPSLFSLSLTLLSMMPHHNLAQFVPCYPSLQKWPNFPTVTCKWNSSQCLRHFLIN